MSFGKSSSIQRTVLRIREVGACLPLFFAALSSHADDRRLRECPVAVRQTVEENLLGGKVDEIKEIRINDYILFLVEIDLKGFKEARLYVSGDGILRKASVEIRLQDLPEPVRLSLERQVRRRGQIKDIEKEIIEGTVRYRVEIEKPKEPDRMVIFEEDGSVSYDK